MKKFLTLLLAILFSSQVFAQYTPTSRIVTKTTIAANTSTIVCSSASALKTEVQVQTGSVGLGLRGQTLTGASYGTGATDPDLVLSAANALYTDIWGLNAQVTAYSATSQVVICIQTVRSGG